MHREINWHESLIFLGTLLFSITPGAAQVLSTHNSAQPEEAGKPMSAPKDSLRPEQQQQQQQPNDELSDHLQRTKVAIAKFKSMGVGVAPFEKMLSNSNTLLQQGRVLESRSVLTRLDCALQEQQDRFYYNKMKDWRSQRKNLIAYRVGVRPEHRHASASSRQYAARGLSSGIHQVLSGAKAGYNPLIYPIAR